MVGVYLICFSQDSYWRPGNCGQSKEGQLYYGWGTLLTTNTQASILFSFSRIRLASWY